MSELEKFIDRLMYPKEKEVKDENKQKLSK